MSNPDKPKSKMGRKVKFFDWDKLNIYCQYKMTLADCADLLDCSEDLIQINIRKKYDITFSAYRNKKMSKTRLFIIQSAIDLVKKGNVAMSIFLLKNFCGFSDNPGGVFDEEIELGEPIALPSIS